MRAGYRLVANAPPLEDAPAAPPVAGGLGTATAPHTRGPRASYSYAGDLRRAAATTAVVPKLTREHIGRVMLAGAGFLADAYDLFVINLVKEILLLLYPPGPNDLALVASMALWGAVVGQLVFGIFADFVGRKRIFVTTLVLITIGAIGSACSIQTEAVSVYQQLAFWRFILGVGVGGEYPLSATITSETGTPALRGRLLSLVFSGQGFGSLLSAIVILTCLEAGASYEFTWRFGLAFGAVPGLLAFYFRWTMSETEHFRQLEADKLSVREHVLASATIVWTYGRLVLGTALSWFLLDVVFYGNALFSASVLEIFGLGSTPLDYAKNATYVALMALPGYFLTISYLDKVGRRRLQLGGFLVIGCLYVVLGLAYEQLEQQPWLFMLLYGLTFLGSNFGPNATTYIIPGELFPTAIRATCHGISAAAGKGGLCATMRGPFAGPRSDHRFAQSRDAIGLKVLAVCGAVAFAGAVVTFFLTPSYTAETLEDLHREMGMTHPRLTATGLGRHRELNHDDDGPNDSLVAASFSAQ